MKFQIRKETILLHNKQEDLKIMHLSDLHFFYSEKVSVQISDYVEQSQPDLILLTGDYFDSPRGYRILESLFRKIAANCPVVFIKGNHDCLYGKQKLKKLGELANCTLLDETSYSFTSKRGFTYNIYPWEQVDQVLPNDAASAILLVHNPEHIQLKKMDKFQLVLSGHLHGGQFVFWKSKTGHLYPGSFLYRYCVDRIQLGSAPLIVSKGLGDTLPIRFNCPKEIIEIQIK